MFHKLFPCHHIWTSKLSLHFDEFSFVCLLSYQYLNLQHWNSHLILVDFPSPESTQAVRVDLTAFCTHFLLSLLWTADNRICCLPTCSGTAICQWQKPRTIPGSYLFFKSWQCWSCISKKASAHFAKTNRSVFHFFFLMNWMETRRGGLLCHLEG